MKTTSMQRVWLRMRLASVRFFNDARGIAATEFAMIVPIMLAMFFGAVEVSSGVAVDRKVTLDARTLADLTSQSAPDPAVKDATYAKITDTNLQNFFTSLIPIMKPYDLPPARLQLSEIYVDSNKVAKIQWSKAGIFATNSDTQATLTTSTRKVGDVVTAMLPTALLVKQTYLLFSEVNYNYTPLGIGYVLKNNLTLSDVAYSRPRQVVCVVYATPNPTQPALVPSTNPVNCPES
jgi:Flp pilus assembly protein TadG